VRVAGQHIIPFLLAKGYIKTFAPANLEQRTITSKPVVTEPDEAEEPDEETTEIDTAQ
jgi:hypothetical protein